jgi:hypothetical protein
MGGVEGATATPSLPSHAFQPRLFLVLSIPITSQLKVGYFCAVFDFACAPAAACTARRFSSKGSESEEKNIRKLDEKRITKEN